MKAQVRHGVILWVCVLALLSAAMMVQHTLTLRRDSAWTLERMAYLPQNDRLKPFLCGFTTVYADYLWIETSLYFGSHIMTDKQYPYLINLVDMVTRLNPNFYPAYEFAGIIIPEVCHNPDAARVILERGMSGELGRRRWQLFFYSGMLYFKYYNDTKSAAEFIARAAQVPDAPITKLAGVAATFYARSGNAAQARAFLTFLYENTQSPAIRSYLLEKLRKY